MLGWIATAMSVAGVLLNAKKNIWCWPVWLASNVLWIYISVVTNNLPQVVLWVIFAASNCYGYFQWKK